MNEKDPSWMTYEEVAAHVLNDIRDKFAIDRFEGKQAVAGERSGTSWEIDAKGVRLEDGAFFLVEVRRHTTSRQSQEKLGALAYRILDTGAAGAFIVSPLGIQEGAQKVADAEGIHSILLNKEATPEKYIVQFLKHIMVRVTTKYDISKNVTESISIAYTDKDGNPITPEEMTKRSKGKEAN